MTRHMTCISFIVVLDLAAAGCAWMGIEDEAKYIAALEPTQGNSVRGAVTFQQRGEWVRISGTVSGLKPGAEHGFHIHETGDCSSGDGMSAGGHFNPGGKPHGDPGSVERHVGDLPNLKADANGQAVLSLETNLMRLGLPGHDIVDKTVAKNPCLFKASEGRKCGADIIGKALIVHRDPDDYKTQPTGNSGPRIACAVIK